MRDVEARVLNAIDETETVDLLAETVRVPSVTGTDAESELQHRFARLLAEAGMDVDVWRLGRRSSRRSPRSRIRGCGPTRPW
jgi:acetylornithine deacetylase